MTAAGATAKARSRRRHGATGRFALRAMAREAFCRSIGRIGVARRWLVTEQPKRKLMARLRARRQTEGLVRIEVWVKPEHVARVRKYIARLARASSPTGAEHG